MSSLKFLTTINQQYEQASAILSDDLAEQRLLFSTPLNRPLITQVMCYLHISTTTIYLLQMFQVTSIFALRRVVVDFSYLSVIFVKIS